MYAEGTVTHTQTFPYDTHSFHCMNNDTLLVKDLC